MGVPIDGIRVGEWLLVVGSREAGTDSFGQPITICDRMVTGLPLKVIGVSPPFVACMHPDGNSFCSVDTRDCSLSRAAPGYVKAFSNVIQEAMENAECECQQPPTQPKAYPRSCPLCGNRMAERRVGSGRWELICQQCKFRGTAP